GDGGVELADVPQYATVEPERLGHLFRCSAMQDPIWIPIGLGVQRTAEGLQAGFVECLAACGMCMNGGSNILQARTHFERQSKCSGQFRHILTDGLEPEKYAIILLGPGRERSHRRVRRRTATD